MLTGEKGKNVSCIGIVIQDLNDSFLLLYEFPDTLPKIICWVVVYVEYGGSLIFSYYSL